jgi:pSer/pThr/pTyr-binding forkhead associated (FHA) protein
MAGPRLTKISNGRQFDVTAEVVVGRVPDCNLRLDDPSASRRHARLEIVAGRVWLEDLGSANGTFVNGVRIAERVKLASGDRIRFHTEEFDFFQPGLPVTSRIQIRESVDLASESRGPTAQWPPPLEPAPPSSADEAPPKAEARVASQPRLSPVASEAPPQPFAEKPPASATASSPGLAALSPKPEEAPQPPRKAPPESGIPGAEAPPSQLAKENPAWIDPAEIKRSASAHATRFAASDDVIALRERLNRVVVPDADVEVPQLRVLFGVAVPKTYELRPSPAGAKTEWAIGRNANCAVVLDSELISDLHAVIVNEGPRWKIIDKLSSNGVLVNGERRNPAFLDSGYRITLGQVVECVFLLPKGGKKR